MKRSYLLSPVHIAAAGRHADGHNTNFQDEDEERGESDDMSAAKTSPSEKFSSCSVWSAGRPDP